MEHPLYQPAPDSMRVIETLGYHRDEGCRHLDLHLARLQRSAQALEFRINLTAIRTRLQSIKKRSATPLSAYRGARQSLCAKHCVLSRRDKAVVGGDCATAPCLR